MRTTWKDVMDEEREQEIRTLLADCLKLIEAVEWADHLLFSACPACGYWKERGHAPDCQLAALKARLEALG